MDEELNQAATSQVDATSVSDEADSQQKEVERSTSTADVASSDGKTEQAEIPKDECCSASLNNSSSSSSSSSDSDDDDENETAERSSLCELDWMSFSGDFGAVQERMMNGLTPREILNDLLPGQQIKENASDADLWRCIVNVLSQPLRRPKLSNYNTLDDVVQLLRNCSKILILTGAGISVSCGIPDFRSRNGIYARLSKDYPDLPHPSAMFQLSYFLNNPHPFFDFAREIFPGLIRPSLCHRFIKELENRGKLLRNYTQNIDTLETIAGINRVVQCHGSFSTATCCVCKHKVDSSEIKDDIFKKNIPKCQRCPPETEKNFMKPDIVFFGEQLPEEFHATIIEDKTEVDLLIVIGSSLKVRPVACLPNSIAQEAPQILINREPLPHLDSTFDIELLGDCEVIISELITRLGWEGLCDGYSSLKEITELPATSVEETAAQADVLAEEPSAKRLKTEDAADAESTNDQETTDEQRLAELRKMFKPRMQNLARALPADSYLFLPPNRYVFPGAEVLVPIDDLSSSSDSESSEDANERVPEPATAESAATEDSSQ